jgi:hypothetical protein
VLWIVLAMLLVLLVAGLVFLYVAFPHRGADVPRMPWVSRLLRRGVEALPTLENQRRE